MTNKKRILYLHVGFGKTATTSIQRSLEKSSKELRKYDICFLKEATLGVHELFLDDPHRYRNYVLAGLERNQVDEIIDAKKQRLVSLIQNTKESILIISDEILIQLTPSEVYRLKEFLEANAKKFEIRIIICVRETIAYCTSVYQELLKEGRPNDFVDKKFYRDLYRSSVSKYIAAFSRDNVIVYQFERSIEAEYGPVGFFLGLIGLPESEIGRFDQIKSNESMSQLAVEILEYINSREPYFVTERNFVSVIGKVSAVRFRGDTKSIGSIRGSKFLIDDKTIEKIKRENETDIKWLENEYDISYSATEHRYAPNMTEYDRAFREDILRIFPTLSSLLQSYIYSYLVELDKRKLGESSLATAKEARQWIRTHYPSLEQGKHDTIDALKEVSMLKRYRECGRGKRILLKNLFLYLRFRKKGRGIFDEKFYLMTYFNNNNVNMMPTDKGLKQMRDILFQVPILRKAVTNSFLYYILRGVYEGHNPCVSFDTIRYLRQNGDLVSAGDNAFFTFLQERDASRSVEAR